MQIFEILNLIVILCKKDWKSEFHPPNVSLVFFPELSNSDPLAALYRVSQKNSLIGFDIEFDISWLQRGLEIPSWTFFNCPFCVDFKNIEFFIIWYDLD